ncbi:MAG: hypothetical protein ACYCSF_07370 [Acidimicrobiales bacterium]
MRRQRNWIAALGVGIAFSLATAGCTAVSARGATPRHGGHPARLSPLGKGSDPRTARALLAIAVRFNEDYAANKDGPVYDRWDTASQAVITRASYLRRHLECPTSPGPAVVERATASAGGYWKVDYSIGGVQLVDYWHYEDGRWRFDLLLSNPSAVALYRLPFAEYAKAVGCTPSR